MLDTKAFADTIKKLRTSSGLSQSQLAKKIGVSRSAISMWELGTRLPDVAMLYRLAECLNVDMQALLTPILGKADEDINIIVVEDVPALLSSTVELIREVIPDAIIKGFISGPLAISNCKRNYVDIAFIDINLDEYMNGMELARHLKELNPYIDIIYVTRSLEYIEEAFYNHCSGYVVKPLTKKRVLHELRNLRNSRYRVEVHLPDELNSQ